MTNSIQTDKRPRLFPREDNYEVVKYVNETLNFFIQNHWFYFNQIWHKSSFGEGDSSLYKWRTNFTKKYIMFFFLSKLMCLLIPSVFSSGRYDTWTSFFIFPSKRFQFRRHNNSYQYNTSNIIHPVYPLYSYTYVLEYITLIIRVHLVKLNWFQFLRWLPEFLIIYIS